MSTITYLRSFFKDKNVASITPSSGFLVKRVCRNMDLSESVTIVEYGPGTGVFSDYLVDKLPKGSKMILIELNPDFVNVLKKKENDVLRVYEGSASDVDKILKKEGLSECDYIISGIPFSFIPVEVKENILRQSVKAIRPGGKFLAYQTSTHLKDALERHFGNVTTKYEWLNIPPLCTYASVKNDAVAAD